MAKILKRREIFRSAVTGRFITKAYAKKHPKSTMRQRVKINTVGLKRTGTR